MSKSLKVSVTIMGREVEIEEAGNPPKVTLYFCDSGMFMDVGEWVSFVEAVNEALHAYCSLLERLDGE